MVSTKSFLNILLFLSLLFLYGCSSSEPRGNNRQVVSETDADIIFETAFEEQGNEMYKTSSDSVRIYWLDNSIKGLENYTKCNIFALNCIYKAGYKCPDVYVLTKDLSDTNKFNDIFPVVDIKSPEDIKKGDLIVWNGHIIIFESLVKINDIIYANAIWGGSKKENDGKLAKNNVNYGKYKLEGDYIVRRPLKR
ncbi:MAG TPA: hypothetical protein VIK14_01300 [Ignavibacteria bacterium]